jgi:hypothetical protein
LVARVRPGEPQEREYAYVQPEQLLDLSMTVDLPPGKFLIVAPSTEASANKVGDAFLTGEVRGRKEERVLLLVPQYIPVQTVKTWVRGQTGK